MTTITGQHVHATLGLFSYTAEYEVHQPTSTWIAAWRATVVGAGRTEEFNSRVELMIGSSGAAKFAVEKHLRLAIDTLA